MVAPDLRQLLAPAHTALVLQEVQEGIVGEQSNLPVAAAEAKRIGLVERCSALTHSARAAGVQVIHCTAENRADFKGANHNARLFMGVRKSPIQPLPGSPLAQPCAELGLDPEDLILPRNHGIGPMSGTSLDANLRNLGLTTIVVVGLSLNVAVTNLVFDAVNLAYHVVLPRDATLALPPEYGDAMIDNTLSLVSTITTTAHVVDIWRSWSEQ